MKELNNVKQLRIEKGLTLRDLARLSNVSHATISQVENFQKIPSQIVMIRISKGLNTPTEQVFNIDFSVLHNRN